MPVIYRVIFGTALLMAMLRCLLHSLTVLSPMITNWKPTEPGSTPPRVLHRDGDLAGTLSLISKIEDLLASHESESRTGK